MAASELSPDSVVVKSGQHKELTPKEYSLLIRALDNNLIKKDMKQLRFLCADFFDDKKFLAKEDVTAHEIFSQMKRNGTITNGDLTLLSQLMLLLGKKKLQREVLFPKNIIWEEGMETSLSKFRLMLYKLYQDTQKEDFEKMKQYCSLRLDQDLPRAELERVPNALDLFTLLIDYAVICTDDVNYLSDAVKTLDSKRMLKLVTDYKETLPSKAAEQQPEEKNMLSELRPKMVPKPLPSPPSPSVSGSGPEMRYNRLTSTDTSYWDERASGSSLLRPADLFKRDEAKPFLEKSSLFDAHQPVESLAIGGKGQPNSTTAKTDEIEKKIKEIHLSSFGEGYGSSRPNGTLTITSNPDPEQNKQSVNLDVHSGQHKDLKPPHTEDYERDEDKSLFPPLNLAAGLPQESPDTSVNEKGSVSESHMEGATAWPQETHGEPRKPLVSTAEDKSIDTEGSFTSRELLEEMDPENINLTARTEAEESQLNKMKMSDCEKSKSESNSRDSTWDTLPSIRRPPPRKAYKMTNIPRGKCLLLTYQKFDDDENLKERHGNEKDIEALRPLFKEKLLFDIEEHLNLDYNETKRVIRRVAREDHSNYDCFVLIICSHGNENAVFTKDTEVTPIKDPADPKGTRNKFSRLIDIQEDLLTPFKAEKCKSLAGKPKIFFINSCRREDELFQAYIEVDSDGAIAADGPSKGVASNLKLVPNESDFCVVLSTVPGYSSARRRDYGTIYVESLVRCLEEDYKNYHLTDILTRVNDDLDESMKELKARKHGHMVGQNSPVINTLRKAVYFFTQEE